MGAAGMAAAAPAIGMIGSSLISALGMPQGQDLQSFEGEGALDPRQALTDASGNITDLLDTLRGRANQPVQLRSAYVQQPPVFSGGGLPVPIGLTGTDPALADASLLSLPGLQLPDTLGSSTRRPRQHPDGGVDSNDGYQPHPDAHIYEDRTAVPRGTPRSDEPVNEPNPGSPRTPRRRNGPSAASAGAYAAPNVSGYDDLSQGAGAVELLLRSLMPQGGTSHAPAPPAF